MKVRFGWFRTHVLHHSGISIQRRLSGLEGSGGHCNVGEEQTTGGLGCLWERCSRMSISFHKHYIHEDGFEKRKRRRNCHETKRSDLDGWFKESTWKIPQYPLRLRRHFFFYFNCDQWYKFSLVSDGRILHRNRHGSVCLKRKNKRLGVPTGVEILPRANALPASLTEQEASLLCSICLFLWRRQIVKTGIIPRDKYCTTLFYCGTPFSTSKQSY